MAFVITTVRGEGSPQVVNSTGMDEGTARDWCRNLAANGMDKVTLHSLSDLGLIEPVAVWSKGAKRARKVASTNGAPVEAAAPAPRSRSKAKEQPLRSVPLDEQTDDGPTDDPEVPDEILSSAAAESDADDESKTYEAYCVKCQEKRAFVAREFAEMKNGTLMAKGKCPICDRGINRILPKGSRPEPEWHDEEETKKDAEPVVTVTVADGEAEVEAEPGTKIEDVAEAVQEAAEATVAAPQFSDADKAAVKATSAALNKAAKAALAEKAGPAAKKATKQTAKKAPASAPDASIKATATVTKATPAKKAAPAKRTNKKVEDDTKTVPDNVKDFQRTATCRKCGRKQPVTEKGGLMIFMQHSAPGLDECPGSREVVG